MLNWLFGIIKILIAVPLGLLTRMVEPYNKLKYTPSVDKDALDGLAEKFEQRLNDDFMFTDPFPESPQNHVYNNFIMCEIRGDKPDGVNHYVSDWCLWNGVHLAYCSFRAKLEPNNMKFFDHLTRYAKQYTDNWIDREGYIRRGWYWKGQYKMHKYKISLDQVAGLVYGLSCVPERVLQQECADKIILLAERLIEDKFEFKTPDGSDKYDTKVKLGPLSTGLHAAIGMSIMKLAYIVSYNVKYLDTYNSYKRKGASLLLAVPITKVFDFIRGFNFNITLLALCALNNLDPNYWPVKLGIKWTWWLNRRVYNPWWSFLYMYHTGERNDFEINEYMLSTFDEKSGENYAVGELKDWWHSQVDMIELKSYLNEKHYTLPPAYKYKKGDAFLLQSIWRDEKYYGEKTDKLLDNKKYSMLTYLAPYYLYKVLKNENNN